MSVAPTALPRPGVSNMRDRRSARHQVGACRRRPFARVGVLAVAVLAVTLTTSHQATGHTKPAWGSASTVPSHSIRLAADSSADSDDSNSADSSAYSDDSDSEDNVRDDDSDSGDSSDGVTTPSAPTGTSVPRRSANTGQPLALVYRNDPLGDSGDAQDLAKMLQKSRFRFQIHYVGPKDTRLTAELLEKAVLFAQPGGEVDTETAKRDFAHEIPLVQPWVARGGRFLGVCAGGFVAGREGYGVFPGEVGSYVGSPNSQVKDDRDQAIQINWRGRQRTVDFQDGNYFEIPRGTPGVTVLATYNNGLVAAAVATHGRGKAAFTGPHFESSSDDAGHPTYAMDLGFQLLDVLMGTAVTPRRPAS